MPSSRRSHFYRATDGQLVIECMCQCPQAGGAISTLCRMVTTSKSSSVNALKRAEPFLPSTTSTTQSNSNVSMPLSGQSHFYENLPKVDISLPTVSMPSCRRSHFYHFNLFSKNGRRCVNALKRAEPFLLVQHCLIFLVFQCVNAL